MPAAAIALKTFGVPSSRAQPVSEEEIKVMLDQGIEHGMFAEAERDTDDAREETNKKIREGGFSRFPVCRRWWWG